jgi:hypothetical protein
MSLPMDRLRYRVPRRLPVGAKYVVAGYGGEEGNLRVIARYLVLPDGQRINVPADFPCRHRPGRWLSAAVPTLSDPRPKADPKASGKNSLRGGTG